MKSKKNNENSLLKHTQNNLPLFDEISLKNKTKKDIKDKIDKIPLPTCTPKQYKDYLPLFEKISLEYNNAKKSKKITKEEEKRLWISIRNYIVNSLYKNITLEEKYNILSIIGKIAAYQKAIKNISNKHIVKEELKKWLNK